MHSGQRESHNANWYGPIFVRQIPGLCYDWSALSPEMWAHLSLLSSKPTQVWENLPRENVGTTKDTRANQPRSQKAGRMASSCTLSIEALATSISATQRDPTMSSIRDRIATPRNSEIRGTLARYMSPDFSAAISEPAIRSTQPGSAIGLALPRPADRFIPRALSGDHPIAVA